MAMPPKRILQHEIDSETCKIVTSLFSRTWELRDLTGRDFGIDKIVEKFEDGYATGEMLLLQIKGTEKPINSTNPKFSLETKTLLYAEMFSTPFLLLYCSLTPPQKCYYIWLQEYIRVRLNVENPSWREQDTNTVYFPTDNLLGSKKAEEHLSYIAKFPQYKDSWVEYYTALEDLCYDLPRIYDKEFEPIFIDPSYQHKFCTEVKRKLDNASLVIKNIPNRFIPDCFFETKSLCKTILEEPALSPPESIQKLIQNCMLIESSIAVIAQRFNSRYLRSMYEIEGSADY